MKIIIVRCASHCNSDTDAHCSGLVEGLRSAGHRTELCILPPIGIGFEALMAVASHRLMDLKNSCDALICLDRVACLIRHSRKFAVLPDEETHSPDPLIASEDAYFLNLIEAGIEEAQTLQLPKRNQSDCESSLATQCNLSPLLRKLK